MKVLILGSAPNAKVPQADIVYGANNSLYYSRDKLLHGVKKVAVIGEHIITATESSKANNHIKAARQLLKETDLDEIVVLRNDPWFDGWDYGSSILDFEEKLFAEISSDDRSSLLKSICNIQEPIVSYSILGKLIRMKPARALSQIVSLIKKSVSYKLGRCGDSHPITRPSTGMIAVLYAMHTHGASAEYIISGISLSEEGDRYIYPGNLRLPRANGIEHHLLADIIIYKKIIKEYLVKIL